jgi:hypothetical protein
MYEYNEAAKGYWRRWERDTKWLAREIVFELISGNPYYENNKKPKNKYDYMPLLMDEVIKETIKERKEAKKISQEELKIIEERLRKRHNGITEKPHSKDKR